MPKCTAIRNSKKSVARNRVAVVAAALGVTAALGAGVASAADGALLNLTSDVAKTVSAQADAQVKAAAAEAKAAQAAKLAKAKAAQAAKLAKAKAAQAAAKAQAAKAAEAAKAKQAAIKLAAVKAAKAEQAAAKKANAWVQPLDKYTLGSTFGLAGNMWSNSHSGQDFVASSGTPVKAAHGGTVVKAGLNSDGAAYGNAIVIKHDNGTYTQYAHLSSVQVQVGQNVSADHQIGLVGSTGNSTGPHLHFEVRTGPDYGTGIEPTGFLRAHGASV
ncbi:M23 family metallopeptidase [Streptomyces sirii]|uniref:M23 family metallopeptidase n=1 Tax=Streptomyces sirii TaxID=3127701 RepID=UPI003D36DFBD